MNAVTSLKLLWPKHFWPLCDRYRAKFSFIFNCVTSPKTNEWNSCPLSDYKHLAETKLGSISLKPKVCEEITSLLERSGGRILHTNQFSESDQSNNKNKSVSWGAAKINMNAISCGPVLGINLHSSVDQSFEIKVWNKTLFKLKQLFMHNWSEVQMTGYLHKNE